MVDTSRLHTITPSEAAALVGVGSHTIRRWCEWHSAHLSPSANPGNGGQRRLTMLDIEVLKEVSNLRLQGLQTEQINEKLAQLTFAEVDNSSSQITKIAADSEELAPLASQEGLQQTSGVIMAMEAMQRRVDAIEQARRFDAVGLVGLGIVIGIAFCTLLIALASLYGG